jgi:cytochrome oxidase Cu insertion factor (SCO1/SenC/PrrC family)
MLKVKFMFIALVLLAMCASAGAEIKSTPTETDQVAFDFTLPDQNGKLWTLSETLKDYQAVVLAFYPKDDTGV